MLQVKIWRNRFISILEVTSWHASTIKNLYVYANQKLWIWPCDKNLYYQNWLKNLFPKPCTWMLYDASRKGWWTFKIKVRLICLIYFKETFTNESCLYFASPPSPRKTSCNIPGFGNKFLACYNRIKMFFAFTENLPKVAYHILEAQRRYKVVFGILCHWQESQYLCYFYQQIIHTFINKLVISSLISPVSMKSNTSYDVTNKNNTDKVSFEGLDKH